MGDIIMSGPAISALKNSFSSRITLLASKMGSPVAPHMPNVDNVIIADMPWVKTDSPPSAGACFVLAEKLRSEKFDLAVIFTVYSQSALPAAMLCFLAGIPRRLAYCRENPYHLLTDWIPDKEPYAHILHQVERDLELVHAVGARTPDDRLDLHYNRSARLSAIQKAAGRGIDPQKPWILLHPGVSEEKRQYPLQRWIEAAALLQKELGMQLVISGSGKEIALAEAIRVHLPLPAWSVAGAFSIEEFIAFVGQSALVISVNTATAHIATALKRPLVVLYARTNPQHTPWKGESEVLQFSAENTQLSRNEVIRWVHGQLYADDASYPNPDAEKILLAVRKLLRLPKLLQLTTDNG